MDNVIEFLKEHPSPLVRRVSTIKDGYVKTIEPVPTVFGPEIHCAPDKYDEVLTLIRSR